MSTESNEQYRAGFEALAPRVEECIAGVMDRFHGEGKAAQARYFEEVHQHLAPLARQLEREVLEANASAAAAWEQLRARKRESSTEPSDWRERAARACENESVDDSTGTEGDVAYNHAIRDCKAAIRALPAGALSDDAKDAAEGEAKAFQAYMASIKPIVNPEPLQVWLAASREGWSDGMQEAQELLADEIKDAGRYRKLRELMCFSEGTSREATMTLSAPLPAPHHDFHTDWIADRFDISVNMTVDALPDPDGDEDEAE